MIGAYSGRHFRFSRCVRLCRVGPRLFFFYLGRVMLHAYGIEDRVVPPKEGRRRGVLGALQRYSVNG
jgi:hypothetical protein